MINTKKYGELLAGTLPSVIDSKEEYQRVEEIFNQLITKGEDNLSPEETKLFALFADLMEAYETRILELLPDLSPSEVLESLMREHNLKQNDLTDIFSTQSVVSEVLNGRRKITVAQAKNLAQKFKMKVEAFI